MTNGFVGTGPYIAPEVGDCRTLGTRVRARACECMNVNADVHVRQIAQLEKDLSAIVASSTQLMCTSW